VGGTPQSWDEKKSEGTAWEETSPAIERNRPGSSAHGGGKDLTSLTRTGAWKREWLRGATIEVFKKRGASAKHRVEWVEETESRTRPHLAARGDRDTSLEIKECSKPGEHRENLL